MLLEAGAEVNVQNNKGDSPLHLAGFPLARLLREGRQRNISDMPEEENKWENRVAKYTRELEETVRALLKAGAEVNVQNNTGDSPLHLATVEEVAQALLEAGAEVNVQNIKGRSPLHDSIKRGHIGVTRMLLEAGAA
eukprot:8286461-Pyramimonas_sp.AAC.1